MYITNLSAEHEVGVPTEYEDIDLIIHGTLPQVRELHPYAGNKHYDQQKGYDLKSGTADPDSSMYYEDS
jgi:hypothetical protein